MTGTAAGIRQRARMEVMAAILASARRQLVQVGPAALSLRAVARDIGMVSSAVYRYVASRDELLTLLIIATYDDLGEHAEAAESAVARDDSLGRWLAICHATRDWALGNRNEYALIFGTPVPGYAAPTDTVGPATRIPTLMLALLADLDADLDADLGADHRRAPAPALDDAVVEAMSPLAGGLPVEVSAAALAPGLVAWTHLFGAISFELFGHRHNVIAEDEAHRRAFFDYEMRLMANMIGIP